MSVALLTFHAFDSWDEDHPRGYVQRGKPGIQPTSKDIKQYRDRITVKPAVCFDAATQQHLIDFAHEACQRREWKLHAASITPTHVHLLVSWPLKTTDANVMQQDCNRIAQTLKRVMGWSLSKRENVKGRRWFSRGWDDRWVRNRRHFEFLVNRYMPKHVHEGGTFRRFD